MIETLSQSNEAGIASLLEGRRIVEADLGEVEIPAEQRQGTYHWTAEGRLVLDDGTVLYLIGNEGCGGCPNGAYHLTKVGLTTADNVITRAEVRHTVHEDKDGWGEPDETYAIFVFVGADEINVAEFNGSDGNGYYGTGFELLVVKGAL